LCVFERVEDRVQEQFSKVVDAVADERSDGKVVCKLLALGLVERLEVDAGEVEKSGAVVRCEVMLGLVVVGVCAVERGVYDVLDAVECVQNRFACIEVLAGGVEVAEA